ncbi:hypothetical protein FKN01_17190 [Streptomyces sp. 130]|nr:hypothetical protein FKN01_17190 [Streptomyces sp. 130]
MTRRRRSDLPHIRISSVRGQPSGGPAGHACGTPVVGRCTTDRLQREGLHWEGGAAPSAVLRPFPSPAPASSPSPFPAPSPSPGPSSSAARPVSPGTAA